MKKIILKKISLEISRGIDTEPKVLYFLAEIRKFLDGQDSKIKNRYPNLYFFCNWALHIKMDRTPAKKLLQRFKRNVSEVESNSLGDIQNAFVSKEISFYMLIDLKKEIRAFIKSKELPDKLVKNVESWEKFRYLLLEILMDCPLINNRGKIVEFSFIKAGNKKIRFRLKIKNKGIIKITLKDATEKIMQELSYKD